MTIKTNMSTMTPRRQQFKREIILLSHGFSNKAAWPDGKITVYPWDSEIDQYLVKEGRKLTKQQLATGLIEHLCELNGGKVENLVADEVQTILLVARALSSDGIVVYTSACPAPGCGAKRQEKIKVPDELEKVGEKSDTYPGYDEITLPVSKDVVHLRPILVKDERIIENRLQEQKETISDILLRLLMAVVSVNGGQPDVLEELVTYYRALPPKDAKFLEEQQIQLSPHLNTRIMHSCDECGKVFSQMLTFDQEFFL